MCNNLVKKAVILAGGKGTRLAEETSMRPKPMVEIGSKPILWHIMKIYSHYNINDFLICLGYKGNIIKEYFINYALLNSDITLSTKSEGYSKLVMHRNVLEDWKVTLIDTGEETMTGGRLKRIKSYLQEDEHFCMTYGDGVGNIDISKLITFHRDHGKLATLTGVKPYARFGALHIEDNLVTKFQEKPDDEVGYINGGFFVLSPKVLDYIENDETVWEQQPLQNLALNRQLAVYLHNDFWHPMDSLRDNIYLNTLWSNNNSPWKVW